MSRDYTALYYTLEKTIRVLKASAGIDKKTQPIAEWAHLWHRQKALADAVYAIVDEVDYDKQVNDFECYKRWQVMYWNWRDLASHCYEHDPKMIEWVNHMHNPNAIHDATMYLLYGDLEA